MSDFYLKIKGDPNFQENKIETTNLLEQYLQQIEMILFTRQTEVLGEDSFGANLEDMIYTLNISEGLIKTVIMNQIMTYCPLYQIFKTDININFYKGTERDIAIIDIIINDNLVGGLVVT